MGSSTAILLQLAVFVAQLTHLVLQLLRPMLLFCQTPLQLCHTVLQDGSFRPTAAVTRPESWTEKHEGNFFGW